MFIFKQLAEHAKTQPEKIITIASRFKQSLGVPAIYKKLNRIFPIKGV